ncbi:gamma-glutamyltransferase [Halobacillus andaensis]|uniref:Glutathione hydrolase proenzyme n=1 Tax=Halobacillus andaensis TaxID=1176239 RepID=A0A917EX92_HALAA|nr:gamma-glutamyltransferase [Halobacillus andaensis]MBP2005886.1 gamma-glutamyltranspeptidase/glutathione hydrolase [Halobacillus andaensis]GGF25321.1 gamma-glutamyltransferase [Halobacillus andaensis]
MKKNDYLYHPYKAQRMSTISKKGMVATSQPLASQAGLDMLKKGGNAIDAAIATAAALTVVEPTSNGIGGDAFALVWVKDKLYGLNSSGHSPSSISIDDLRSRGYEAIPKYGLTPVTVPGAPGAWAELSRRFGKLPLTEVLAPAIDYANNGFPVSPVLGKFWHTGVEKFKTELKGEEFEHWFETFAPKGKAPRIGELWKSQNHADTLRKIAESNAEAFYHGELADKIDAFSRKHNGYIRKEDLINFKPEWVDPISVNYRGYDVWEIPPNGQGLVALSALNIMNGFNHLHKEDVTTYHCQIEAMKLAFADGQKFIADANHMNVEVDQLLSSHYAQERRALIGEEALVPEAGVPPKGGTVYLAAADEEGNMVSFIQSNYMGFGAGVVIPGTGISLQNRGHNFSMDPNHVNALGGNKRSYHTIIPGFLTKDNKAVGPFGVMGGFMQPQGHMQVIMNTIDFNLNPQAALDAPRWQWMKEKTVYVEPDFPSHIAQALYRKGHEIEVQLNGDGFGRGQMILRDENTGVLFGGTESRTDGTISAY